MECPGNEVIDQVATIYQRGLLYANLTMYQVGEVLVLTLSRLGTIMLKNLSIIIYYRLSLSNKIIVDQCT